MPRYSRSVYENHEIRPRESYQQRTGHASCAPHGEGPLPSLDLIGQTLRKVALHLHSGRWTIAVRVIDTAKASIAEERAEAANERERRAEIRQLMAVVDALLGESAPQEPAAYARSAAK